MANCAHDINCAQRVAHCSMRKLCAVCIHASVAGLAVAQDPLAAPELHVPISTVFWLCLSEQRFRRNTVTLVCVPQTVMDGRALSFTCSAEKWAHSFSKSCPELWEYISTPSIVTVCVIGIVEFTLRAEVEAMAMARAAKASLAICFVEEKWSGQW